MSTYVNVTMDNELATWVGSLSKFANGLTSLIDIEVLLVVGLASKLEYWWMLELATESESVVLAGLVIELELCLVDALATGNGLLVGMLVA